MKRSRLAFLVSLQQKLHEVSRVDTRQWFTALAASWVTGDFKKHRYQGPTPRYADVIDLGGGLGTWNFESSPGDSNVQPRLRTTVLKGFPCC